MPNALATLAGRITNPVAVPPGPSADLAKLAAVENWWSLVQPKTLPDAVTGFPNFLPRLGAQPLKATGPLAFTAAGVAGGVQHQAASWSGTANQSYLTCEISRPANSIISFLFAGRYNVTRAPICRLRDSANAVLAVIYSEWNGGLSVLPAGGTNHQFGAAAVAPGAGKPYAYALTLDYAGMTAAAASGGSKPFSSNVAMTGPAMPASGPLRLTVASDYNGVLTDLVVLPGVDLRANSPAWLSFAGYATRIWGV